MLYLTSTSRECSLFKSPCSYCCCSCCVCGWRWWWWRQAGIFKGLHRKLDFGRIQFNAVIYGVFVWAHFLPHPSRRSSSHYNPGVAEGRTGHKPYLWLCVWSRFFIPANGLFGNLFFFAHSLWVLLLLLRVKVKAQLYFCKHNLFHFLRFDSAHPEITVDNKSIIIMWSFPCYIGHSRNWQQRLIPLPLVWSLFGAMNRSGELPLMSIRPRQEPLLLFGPSGRCLIYCE